MAGRRVSKREYEQVGRLVVRSLADLWEEYAHPLAPCLPDDATIVLALLESGHLIPAQADIVRVASEAGCGAVEDDDPLTVEEFRDQLHQDMRQHLAYARRMREQNGVS